MRKLGRPPVNRFPSAAKTERLVGKLELDKGPEIWLFLITSVDRIELTAKLGIDEKLFDQRHDVEKKE